MVEGLAGWSDGTLLVRPFHFWTQEALEEFCESIREEASQWEGAQIRFWLEPRIVSAGRMCRVDVFPKGYDVKLPNDAEAWVETVGCREPQEVSEITASV
jgi:hypothetical protein